MHTTRGLEILRNDFGAGSHLCPGATLARREGLIALQVLFERIGDLQPVPDAFYPPLPGSLGHFPVYAADASVTSAALGLYGAGIVQTPRPWVAARTCPLGVRLS